MLTLCMSAKNSFEVMNVKIFHGYTGVNLFL